MKSTKMLKGLASILLIFIVMLASLATSQSASYDENFNEWFGIGVANDDAKPTNVDEQLNNDRQLINDTNGDKRAVQPVGDLKTEQLEPAMVAQVAPGAPTGLVATLGDRQITLSWNAYYTDLDVYFFYEVGYKRSDESEWTNTVLVTSPFITIYSLTNRIKYDFRVCVRLLDYPPPYNYATISAIPLAPSDLPGAPTGLVAAPGDRQTTLSWNAYYTDLDVYFFYEVGYKRSDESEWTNTVLVTSRFITIYGLTNGIKYDFRVCVRLLDYPPPYNYATISAIPLAPSDLPGAPTNFTATPGDGQVALSWDAYYTDLDVYFFYEVVYKRSDESEWTNGLVTSPVTTFYGLTNGIKYDFRVCVRLLDYPPPYNYATISATPVGPTAPPIAPRNLTAVPGDGQVALSWELMYTFPELILFYEVGYKRSSDNVWTNCEVFIPSITVTDLTNGVEYDFRVRFCLRDRMGENRPPFDSDYATISATPR